MTAQARRIPQEQTLTVAIGLPETGFEMHANRVKTILAQNGYTAHPLTGAHILQLADDIKAELAITDQGDTRADRRS